MLAVLASPRAGVRCGEMFARLITCASVRTLLVAAHIHVCILGTLVPWYAASCTELSVALYLRFSAIRVQRDMNGTAANVEL